MQRLHIIPVGPEVPPHWLRVLSDELARRFGVTCRVDPKPVDIGFVWDARRNQYFSTPLLNALLDRTQDHVLGVAALDLFVPVLTFVFGEAQLEGRAAIISGHRLRDEFYGLPADEGRLAERLVKEAVHELGHTTGLRHCDDWACVMASSHGVERIDIKSATFCPACQRYVNLKLPR